MITQQRLQQLFDYSTDTGLFTRKTSGCSFKAGEIAGSADSHGYTQLKVDGKIYLAHRLVWLYQTGKLPSKWIDHINGVRSDNRWVNLREVTPAENNWNAKTRADNKTGVSGVMFKKSTGKYVVRISVNGVRLHLGSFDSLEKAVTIRKEAQESLWKYTTEHIIPIYTEENPNE